MLYEIATDGRTVWINGASLLGRFSKNGIDVHVEGRCLKDTCATKTPTTQEDWDSFKQLMKKIHNIVVKDKFKPNHLRNESDKIVKRIAVLYASAP